MFEFTTLSKLKAAIEECEQVAITSHFPPDHDSVSSTLLLQNLLKSLYPNKVFDCVSKMSMEGKFADIDFLDMSRFIPSDTVNWKVYDLIILVDVEDLERAVYVEKGDNDLLSGLKSKTIVIDHHDCKEDPRNMLNICKQNYCSSTHLVVRLFQECFPELVIDKQASRLAQLGIIADSNRFLYGCSHDVLDLMSHLSGITEIDIELLSEKLNKLPRNGLVILETLIHNMQYVDESKFAYSYYNLDVYDIEGMTETDIKEGCSMFLQHIAKNLVGINTVCLLKPYRNQNLWRVMFRSKKETLNVSVLAKKFNGGGHVNASSCVIEAVEPEEVIQQIERYL